MLEIVFNWLFETLGIKIFGEKKFYKYLIIVFLILGGIIVFAKPLRELF